MKRALFGFIIGIIVTLSLVVGATIIYNASDISYVPTDTSWEVNNINEAIEDLHSDITIKPLEKIYTSLDKNVDYEYTITENGKYLVGALAASYNKIAQITTTGKEVFNEGYEGTDHRKLSIYIIEAKVGDKIHIRALSEINSNTFIFKLNNRNITSTVNFKYTYDGTSTISYTATKPNEKILVLSLAVGKSRSNSITYNKDFTGSVSHSNNIWVDYTMLNANETVTVSAYGYDWGAGVAVILK